MRRSILILSSILLASLTVVSALSAPTTPPSGTLSTSSPTVTFTGGPDIISNPTPDPAGATGGPVCNTAAGEPPCDNYTLNVNLPVDYQQTNPHALITISLGWNGGDDYDLYAYNSTGSLVASSATSNDPEVIRLPACQGSYALNLSIVPYTAEGDAYTGTITLNPDAGNSVTCGGNPPAPGASGPGVPRFQNYPAPSQFDGFENEPSVGVDWKTGNVMFSNIGIRNVGGIAGLAQPDTLRIGFDFSTSPARTTWSSVGFVTTSQFSLDPILFTDSSTNRTFVTELSGACSFAAFTDDDGSSWTPSQGCGIPAGADHPSVGGGPYAGGVLPVGVQAQGLYPDAVYYCSQDIFTAFCARSDDGGLTYGPGVPIYFGTAGLLPVGDYNLVQCQGLHGHIKVGPDGTVYVPNADCSGHPALAVSEDNGLTWNVRPDYNAASPAFSGSDPSAAVASDGTLYFCYQGADAHAHVAVSTNHGLTWTYDQDVSGPIGVVNTVFPTAVAGDPNRAACAFLGSTTAGDYQAAGFAGTWQLYVAYTYDGGASWKVVDATPNDPVQGPGGICTGGTTCPGNNRNLLDFIDSHLDAHGNVVIGYADGCTGSCASGGPNPFDSLPTVAYQSGGNPLFAQYDPVEPAAPKAPLLDSASQDASGAVQIAWQTPDDGGAAISGYRVYRGTASGAETLLATLNSPKTTYTDASALPPSTGAVYYYEISASNSVGEGSRGNELAAAQPVLPPSPCRLPGLTVVTDPSGDQTGAPANTEMDIQSLAIAEPYFTDGSQRLVFTLKVQDLNTLPANAYWKAYFEAPDGTTYFVDMNTTNAQGAPSFEYGHVAVGPSGSDDVVDGVLDSDSGYSADGTIRLVAEDADIGGLAAGNVLQQVHATTQLLAGGSGTGVLQTMDTTVNGSYTLVGNASCQPNNPPVAALAASPVSGTAPLTVQFSGSGSYDPDGDSVSQYAFDFGDGSTPVTQSSPVISHTYPQSGEYEATLTVTDSKGLASKNTASLRINVEQAPAGAQEMRGSGTIPVEAAGDTGRFDLDVTSVNTGRFHWQDKTHGIEFETKNISGFSRLGNCVSFSGIGMLEEQGGSVSFTATGCDNGPAGSGLDTFSIQLSGAATGDYSGALQHGDLVLFVRGASSGDND